MSEDRIREAIQAMLDALNEGWSISHYVIPLGIERVVAGEIESAVWMYVPPYQPDYIATGLLYEADAIQHGVEVEDD